MKVAQKLAVGKGNALTDSFFQKKVRNSSGPFFQQSANGIQRQAKPKNKYEKYIDFLVVNNKIEAASDSKKKVLYIIKKSFKKDSNKYIVPYDFQYLLINELLHGGTKDKHQKGILEILERLGDYELNEIFKPGKIDLTKLLAAHTGTAKTRLGNFFKRRYKGGLAAVKKRKFTPRSAAIPIGMPLKIIDDTYKLVKWLKTNKKSAAKYFGQVWGKNKIVVLGDYHVEDVQRIFAKDMINKHGNNKTGLALEIDVAQQRALNYFIKHKRVKPGFTSWWTNKPLYKDLITAASNKNMTIIAMDDHSKGGGSLHRDKHMAQQVKALNAKVDKILVYVGAWHIREATKGRFGQQLKKMVPADPFAISMYATGPEQFFYQILKDELPREKSLGFDVSSSPIASTRDIDSQKTFDQAIDGMIYFKNKLNY